MAANNFKLFDENKQNMLNDQEYQASQQRLGGVQAGIASSMLNNKFAYQMSLIAYAIAQMMNANGYDATDALAVSAFVDNLSNSVLQKVIDKATTAQAQAGTDNTKWMTPALVNAAVNALVATQAEAEAGTSNMKVMSPLRVAQVNTPIIASLKTKRPNIIRTLPIAAGNTVAAGDVVDIVSNKVTKAGTPTQAIALQAGTAGQSIDIIFDGVAELSGITAGTQIASAGVQGYAPQDGWLWVRPSWAKLTERGTKLVFGSYTGNNVIGRKINLGFKPLRVDLIGPDGTYMPELILFSSNRYIDQSGSTRVYRDYSSGGGAAINDVGFVTSNFNTSMNKTGEIYYYWAYKDLEAKT